MNNTVLYKKVGIQMYNKLKEIFDKVNFIIDNGNSMYDIDTVTKYQCELPYDLKDIEQELLTMFE